MQASALLMDPTMLPASLVEVKTVQRVVKQKKAGPRKENAFKVSYIQVSGSAKKAEVNGEMLTVGSLLDGYRVIKIMPTQVVFLAPDHVEETVTMFGW